MTDKTKKILKYVGTGLTLAGAACLCVAGFTTEGVASIVTLAFAGCALVGSIINLFRQAKRKPSSITVEGFYYLTLTNVRCSPRRSLLVEW